MSDLVSVTKSEGKLHMLGGILDEQMFTPQELKNCAQLPPLVTQHVVISKALTQLQSTLRTSLLHNQQKLSSLLKQIPEKV